MISRKYIFIIIFAFIPFCISAADIAPSIYIQGNGIDSIDLVIEYPVSSNHTVIPILYPSSPDGNAVFVSAKSDTNRVYQVTSGVNESTINAQPDDKKIYVTYKLKNQILSSDVGLYSFMLIYEKIYSNTVNIKIKNSGIEILAPRMYNSYTNKISNSFYLTLPDASESFRSTVFSFMAISKGKYAPYEIKKYGKYVVITPKNKNRQVMNTLKGIDFTNIMFRKIFERQIDDNVLIAVVPFAKLGILGQDASGLALNPHNIVLIDTAVISYQTSLLYAKKVLIHELTHILMGSINNIQGVSKLNWINEGLAVYADIYASENYLYPKSSLVDIQKIPLNSRLLTSDEKQKAYKQVMDFDVNRDTIDRPKIEMYSHLGTIFNNYFKLKNDPSDFLDYIKSCTNCTNDNVINWMMNKSGLSKDSLIYPN